MSKLIMAGREKFWSEDILLRVRPSGTVIRPSDIRSMSWKIVASATLSLFQIRYCWRM